ncbi:35051_t:CDS:2, partial [Gigaspora margarita]
PILEENIELIQEKINSYKQEISDSTFIIEYKQQISTKQREAEKTRNQLETKTFLKDINMKIPFDLLPEIDEEFPIMDLKLEKLSSYEIQILLSIT